MLTISTILGNIKSNSELHQKYDDYLKMNCLETITIHRSETEKVRMRKSSDKATDVGFILPSRTQLKDGDVAFLDDSKMIVIKLSPELVAILNIKNHPHGHDDDSVNNNITDGHPTNHDNYSTNVAIKVGHTIGNLHRPLKIDKNNIIFPIQSPDEINLFLKLLADLKDHVEIRSDILIFEPDQGFDIHAH